jgi:hypothetical protein
MKGVLIMNTLVLRKPKFMRDDIRMATHMDTIDMLSNKLSNPDLTLGERYELLIEINNCIDMAVEAGGFMNVGEFIKWLNTQNQ